jgi:biotin carboxyl carrier protein
MQSQTTIIFDGKEYQVEIRETGNGTLEVKINGQIHRVTLKSAQTSGKAAVGKSAPTPAAAPIPAAPQAAAPGNVGIQVGVVGAPMPGDIASIAVKPGDQVAVGQELLVLEAMKMKNVIRSPQAGTVASVEVSAGQSVKFGEPLVRFE